jgi:lysophospholipase L1-like esterase
MMEPGIKALRPGPSGREGAPNRANRDESRANPFPNLPPFLMLRDEQPVTTAEMCWKRRRPEIVEDFELEVYGRVPARVPPVTWTVAQTVRATDGPHTVIGKQPVGRVDHSSCTSISGEIQMTVATPAEACGPAPVMMFGHRGLPSGAEEAPLPAGSDPPATLQLISGSWGYAHINPARATELKPAEKPMPPDMPVARTDGNSMLAHAQMVEKAKRGGIDVYFAGDSITRRWGATDYPELLANWNRNFFGWNAGNFGWGGDTIQNILWRLENGELDGVHPKVIVLLAGTNDVGNEVPAEPEVTASGIIRGFAALLRVLQSKAPDAIIVVTGIFPRNDNMAVMPFIDQINERLALMTDGRRIRYLNINDRLAHPDGRLLEGMMDAGDKLHPTVKGYQLWADALKPIFTELLGPPGTEDHAPPPTGNPAARP